MVAKKPQPKPKTKTTKRSAEAVKKPRAKQVPMVAHGLPIGTKVQVTTNECGVCGSAGALTKCPGCGHVVHRACMGLRQVLCVDCEAEGRVVTM